MEPGQLIAFASGEYSDYEIDRMVEVVKPFNFAELATEWSAKYTVPKTGARAWESGRDYVENAVRLMPWLISKGLVKDKDYLEVHVGSYGDSEITIDGEPQCDTDQPQPVTS